MNDLPDPLAAFRARYARGVRCLACDNPRTVPLDALYTLSGTVRGLRSR